MLTLKGNPIEIGENTMKKIPLLLVLIMLVSLLGCAESHEHILESATCEKPAACTGCGKTVGDPLGHNWQDATCTSAQKCSRCGQLQGQPLGHEWVAATCTQPETCIGCKLEKGEPLGHSWNEAACTDKKTCSACGEQEGEPLGHTVTKWKAQQKSTCTEAGLEIGVCTTCGATVEQELPLLDHTPGEWKIIEQPDASKLLNGIRAKYCKVCGQEVENEYFFWTREEQESMYKAECKTYKYDEIARNPGKYKGEKAKFTGKVIQVMQSGSGSSIYYTLRVGIKRGYSYYDDVIYVTYTASETDARILEDDIITMYGKLNGEKTYETTMGASVTIPYFLAEYIDIK